MKQRSPARARDGKRSTSRKRQEAPTSQQRPDYFAMKGELDVDVVRDKLERDLLHNMQMAEKMGVLTVLNDMHYDAETKVNLKNRRRQQAGEETKKAARGARPEPA